jgi:hypothetical protein
MDADVLLMIGSAAAVVSLASAGVWWHRHRFEVWDYLRGWAASAGYAGQE